VKVFRNMPAGRSLLPLFTAMILLFAGTAPPSEISMLRSVRVTPCYGLSSDAADSAAFLQSGQNERDISFTLNRISFAHVRPAMAENMPGKAVREIFAANGSPSSVPPVTAGHLRV